LVFNLFKNISKVNDEHDFPNSDSCFESEEMSTGGKIIISKNGVYALLSNENTLCLSSYILPLG